MPDAYKGFEKDIRVDSLGKFAIGDTLYNHNRKFNEETRPNLVFSIFYNPKTEEFKTEESYKNIDDFIEIKPHPNGDGRHQYHAWRWSKEKIKNESYNLIALPTSKKEYEIHTRIRDFNKTLLKDLITNISNGNDEVSELFDGKRYFDFPKSVNLIKILLGAFNNHHSIILDFFSGSATTAHAVMQLNAEDGGKRKFICVQLPEVTEEDSEAYKAGYKNICEIGKERIRRAGKKIKEEFGEKAKDLDIGFRVLKLADSNMKDVYYSPAETDSADIFDANNVKEDRTPLDLLFQVMPECNLPLSSKIEERTIEGKTVYFVNGNYLVACFDEGITEKLIKSVIDVPDSDKPYYFYMRNLGLESDKVLDNFEQLFVHYSPSTKRKVI